MKKLLLVGCGNMGFAMLENWNHGNMEVSVVEPSQVLRERAGTLCKAAYETAADVPANYIPDCIVFAVKPQIIQDVLPAYARYAKEDTLIVSLAAGTPVRKIASLLDNACNVVRCVPNTPVSIGEGMVVCFVAEGASRDLGQELEALFSTAGKVDFVDHESLLDSVTALSGSGPAYVFLFLECLRDAGLAAGLPAGLSERLAKQTLVGAGLLARVSTQTPEQLRHNVTSPNGTTAAALSVMMEGDGLARLVAEAVSAARTRSIELG